MIIDRYDINGKSVANMLYHLVDNNLITIKDKVVADGSRRLDQYAHEYYGESLNWWIIAAASGISWWFNTTKSVTGNSNVESGVILYIPELTAVLDLKDRGV